MPQAETIARPRLEFITALKSRFGQRASTGESQRLEHGRDESSLPPALPDAVVYVDNPEDIVAVVNLCAQHAVPLIPYGVGSSLEGHVLALSGGIHIINYYHDAIRDGVPLDIQAGATADEVVAPSFSASSLVRGGAPAEARFEATPGDAALLLRGDLSPRQPFGLLLGVLFIGRPARVLSLGPVGASGLLTLNITQPGPSAARDFFARHYQGFVLEAGQRRLTAPRRTWVVSSTL